MPQAAVEPATTGRSSVRLLLRHRSYWRWMAAAQTSRLPMTMTSLALVLLADHTTGSYRLGGALVTATVIAEVVCAPTAGRLLDRVGAARGARASLALSTVGFTALAMAGWLRLPAPVLLAIAAMAAGAAAGVPGGIRTLLAGSVPDRLLTAAVALDATLFEGVIVAGPLLVAALVAIDPIAGVLGMAAAAMIAAALLPHPHRTLPTAPAADAGPPTTTRPHHARSQSLLRNREIVFWLLSALAMGHVLSTVEVAALPLANSLHGGPSTASLLVALLAGSSAMGGLAYTALGSRLTLTNRQQARILLGVMGTCGLLLSIGGSWVAIALAVALMGLCTAPLGTVRSVAMQQVTPLQRRSEGFSLLFGIGGIGFGLGALTLALVPLRVVLLVGALSPLTVVLFARLRTRGSME